MIKLGSQQRRIIPGFRSRCTQRAPPDLIRLAHTPQATGRPQRDHLVSQTRLATSGRSKRRTGGPAVLCHLHRPGRSPSPLLGDDVPGLFNHLKPSQSTRRHPTPMALRPEHNRKTQFEFNCHPLGERGRLLQKSLEKDPESTGNWCAAELYLNCTGKPGTTPNTTPGASHVCRTGSIMCYADTITEIDGTVTAYCCCGWVEHEHTPESADVAAETHQNASDDESLITAA